MGFALNTFYLSDLLKTLDAVTVRTKYDVKFIVPSHLWQRNNLVPLQCSEQQRMKENVYVCQIEKICRSISVSRICF